MNSRERVLATLARERTDRPPVDIHGSDFAFARIATDLGANSRRELLLALGSDIVDIRGTVDPVYRGPVPFSREIEPGLKESFWGWRQRRTEAACGPEESYVDFPLASASTIGELASHRWPEPDWFDFAGFGERLEDWGDFAILASGASVWQHPSFLRGLDSMMMDMLADPGMVEFMIGKFADFYLGYFRKMLEAAGGRIDILRQADDLGTQRALLFSPELFRRYIKPRIAQLADLAHEFGAAFMFHSCGAIRPLIPDLIEAGVDILDPLQALAEGMEPEGLKRDFGDALILHGGIDTQYLLPRGGAGDVEAETRRLVGILGRGGGYIVAPCHVLQSDVPTANALAIRNALESGAGER